jgi:hypothetical protein
LSPAGAALPWLLLLLDVADGVLTRALVAAGVAVEANPAMRTAMEHSTAAFLAAKLALVGLGALLLWRQRRRALAFLSLQACLGAYAAVVAYQMIMVGRFLLPQVLPIP